MKVLVTGGRDYADYAELCRALDAYQPTEIVHGAARGADSLAKQYAIARGIKHTPYPAKWDDIDRPGAVVRYRNGKAYDVTAGFYRNRKMLDESKPDMVLAVKGNNGTADMCKYAESQGYKVIRV